MIGEKFLAKLRERLPYVEAATALEVAAAAKSNAPTSTGRLAESITAHANTVIASAPYAAAVEFRQPYLRPALLSLRENFKERLRLLLKERDDV